MRSVSRLSPRAGHPHTPAPDEVAAHPTQTPADAVDVPPALNAWIDLDGALAQCQRDLGPARLRALARALALIGNAIEAQAEAPAEAVAELHDMQQVLLEAAHQREPDVERLEAQAIDLANRSMALCPSGPDPQGRPAHYGGRLGDAVFQTLRSGTVVPLLAAVLAPMAARLERVPPEHRPWVASRFLRTLLQVAGHERAKIARMTATPGHEAFGQRLFTGSNSMDIVSNHPAGEAWAQAVSARILGVLAPVWRSFRGSQPRSSAEYCFPERYMPWHAMRGQPRRNVMSWRQGTEEVQLGAHDTQWGVLRDVSTPHKLRVSYGFEWALGDETSDPEQVPLVLKVTSCVHKPLDVDEEAGFVRETGLAPAFLAALEGERDPVKFKQRLAALFDDMAQETLFSRGTAAIMEMTIEAIAALHGHALSWSDDWRPPHLSPDLQALVAPRRDSFIETGSRHLHLQPLERPADH
jgi:hypothetical protein